MSVYGPKVVFACQGSERPIVKCTCTVQRSSTYRSKGSKQCSREYGRAFFLEFSPYADNHRTVAAQANSNEPNCVKLLGEKVCCASIEAASRVSPGVLEIVLFD